MSSYFRPFRASRGFQLVLIGSILLLRVHGSPVDNLHDSITSLPDNLHTRQTTDLLPFNGTPDYVIVGGGPAGFVLAEELSRNSFVTVVLLEAGPENAGVENIDTPWLAPFLIGTTHAWNFTSEPDPNLNGRVVENAQGRGFGGGSAINYMAHCRGSASVFDEWAAISGDDGLRWDNFLNNFIETTHFVPPNDFNPRVNTSVYGSGPIELTVRSDDAGADQRFIDALTSNLSLPWLDLNDGHGIGVATSTLGVRASNLTRVFAPQAYGWQLAGRSNVVQLHDSQVINLGFDGTRAVNLTYVRPDTEARRSIYPRETILSAGAFNSPKLLMLSGVGPADRLGQLGIPIVADIPEIGQELSEHHFASMEFAVTNDVESLWLYFNNITFAAEADAQYAQIPAQGPIGTPSGAAFGTLRIPGEVFGAMNDTFHRSLPVDRPHLLFQSARASFSGDDTRNIITGYVSNMQPQSRGNMTIRSSDYRDDPIIHSNFFGTPGDRASILYGYRQLRDIFHDPAIASIIVEETFPGANTTSDEGLYEAIQETAATFHHPYGTVALGTVVEGQTWRVRGLQGLRVVDSSTFPYATTCHPMAVVYAYAHHAAQLIREQDHF